MKLVTFRSEEGLRAGVIVTEYVVDLEKAALYYGEKLPSELISILGEGENALKTIKRVSKVVSDNLEQAVNAKLVKPLAGTSLYAPIPSPPKIICIGLNYKDHAVESNMKLPEYPVVFTKYSNTVNGPYDHIELPKVSFQIDYEAELAFVIGKGGRYISEENAMEHVAGYMCFNDVSARDYQFHTHQFTVGKSFDKFAPMGPWIVTKDEIENPHALNIELKIGDEVLQSSNTKELIFPIQKLVSYLSEAMTLEPGDIIATGTPSGVGFVKNPPRFLKSGDVVTVSIEGIGEIKNKVTK